MLSVRSRGYRGWIASGLVLALLLLAIVAVGAARGERTQSGNLIVALNGGISPLRLPRHRPAPVAVHLDGRIGTADGSALPQVEQVKIEIAGPGLLLTHGLPVCPRARLRNASDRQALRRCGSSLVGRGGLSAQVFIPGQAPFGIRAHLLAFNGRTSARRSAVWVHAFSSDPPVSLVLPFVVRSGSKSFQTVLTAAVPKAVGPLPHLARFHLTLFRRFFYHGKRRSYISGTCPIPPGLTAGFLTFARATYSFKGHRQVKVGSVRSCRAR